MVLSSVSSDFTHQCCRKLAFQQCDFQSPYADVTKPRSQSIGTILTSWTSSTVPVTADARNSFLRRRGSSTFQFKPHRRSDWRLAILLLPWVRFWEWSLHHWYNWFWTSSFVSEALDVRFNSSIMANWWLVVMHISFTLMDTGVRLFIRPLTFTWMPQLSDKRRVARILDSTSMFAFSSTWWKWMERAQYALRSRDMVLFTS